MIYETFYKDRPAVCVSNGGMQALFLPEDGAKLASLKFEGCEFLAQNTGDKYLRLSHDTSYVKSECSAFDDMFPTIDPCSVCGFDYPDHGEVSRTSFEYEIIDDTACFWCEVKSVNAIFSKVVYQDADNLCIKYELENKNGFALPYIWAGHIMLKGEEGAYICSPYSQSDSVTVCFGTPPAFEIANVLEKYGANKEYKYYFDEHKTPMLCTAHFPESKRELSFSFDNDIVKYLAIWMNPGDLNGMYNFAIEPCTAPYDSPKKAKEKGKCSYIEANSKISFTLMIKMEDNKYD